MNNAFGEPQTIVVLGGTSDIGVAIARALISPSTATVVLACRDLDAGRERAADLATLSATLRVEVVSFDATAVDTHADLMRGLADAHGDLDVVVYAAGQLGSAESLHHDPVAAANLAAVNFGGAVSACIATAEVLRRQGHGVLVVLSSVAGERVRSANFVYGSTKAGLDGFAQGLGDSLQASGARVLVVRPGFVHSTMTDGMDPAPFSTTPAAVADAVVKALHRGVRTVWTPGILRVVFSVMRHLPGPVWRRLPLDK